jgi:hypothetical protein
MITAALTIREASLSDYKRLAALSARNGLEVRTQETWEHLWTGNPVYKKFPNWPIGWVAEHDGEVVGFLGNIPISYSFKGREIISACTYSMSVDSRFRGYAVRLINRLFRWADANLEFHLCTTANEHSGKLSERLKVPHVPVGDWGNSAFWIASPHEFLEAALKRKGWPQLLAYPGSAALALRGMFTKLDGAERASELHFCSKFDQRFDVFWEELQKAHPNRLLATRSREVLDWHFKYAEAGNRLWISTLNDGSSRLLAYAVFCRGDNPEFNLKRMCLTDFQSLDGNHEILVPMFSWALRQCKEEGIHMLEAFGFRPDKQCVINRIAPYRRKLRAWSYFYRASHPALREELQQVAVWDTSQFDGDASL